MAAAVFSAKAHPARTGGIAFACVIGLLAAGGAADGAAGETVYEIVPGESRLRILVFRAGSLARLGHNHVVSTEDMSGTAALGASPAVSSLDMTLPVRSFVVDDPAVLEEEGSAFSGERSEDDVEATRRNMLGPDLLYAEAYAEVRIVSEAISGEYPQITIQASIDIRGEKHPVALPAFVAFRDGGLVASGSAEIAHSDLGLSPFSAAFGALRVAEAMIFRYRIVAREAPAAVAESRYSRD